MPNITPTWTDEQVLEINGRAVRLFQQLIADEILPDIVLPGIYQGILNQCGQVEVQQVERGRILPRMDVPRG